MNNDTSLSPAQRELLRRRVERARSAPIVTIARYDGGPAAPLSFAQERLWVMDKVNGSDHTYNVYHAMRLTGDLDVIALRRALDQLGTQHESLRTTFYA